MSGIISSSSRDEITNNQPENAIETPVISKPILESVEQALPEGMPLAVLLEIISRDPSTAPAVDEFFPKKEKSFKLLGG